MNPSSTHPAGSSPSRHPNAPCSAHTTGAGPTSLCTARILLAVLALGCSFAAQAKLNVVATTPDIAAIAQAVGGAHVEITTLARPTEDAHFVDPKPSFVVRLNKADVLLHGGADLESGWLPKLLSGARNSRIAAGAAGNVRCNTGIEMLEVPAALDRSRGDVHAAGNPHYLADPENAKTVAGTIAEAFARLDPDSSAAYQANARTFIERLDTKLVEWRKLLEPHRGARIVAYHNSWPYFARRFELNIDLFLEPKPGIPPSPAHIANVISQMKQHRMRVVLHDPYLNRRTAETVAQSAGARVVDVTQYPGGIKGSEGGYIEMMDCVVRAIAQGLAEK